MHKIEFKNISVSYGGTTALDRLSLEVVPSEFLALLGPSGCGKTTLLRVLGGFVPYTGSVLFDGKPIDDISTHRRGIGIVFQDYALFPHKTVRQNIAFGLRMRKEATARIAERIAEMVELLHLDGLEERYPNQLSGGQQQRVALARAIAIRPAVLLLDEPLSSLDKSLRDEMQIELRRVQKQIGITTIFVTHDQEEALSLADRIAVMRGGAIQQIGSVHEVYERPANRFVAEFVGHANLFAASVVAREGASYRCSTDLNDSTMIAVDKPLAVGQQILILLRPENVSLIRTPEKTNKITGVLDNISYRGGISKLSIKLPTGQILQGEHHGSARTAMTSRTPGEKIEVYWDPADGAIIDE